MRSSADRDIAFLLGHNGGPPIDDVAALLGDVVSNVRDRTDLRHYQTYLADAVFEMEAVMLAVDMGLGKTAATLTAIRKLLDFFIVRRVLIVAPLRVAEETWPDEISAWKHTRVLSFEVLTGPGAQRRTRAQMEADLHIINRENIRWLWALWGDKWPYDMVVWDESSRLKAWKKRTPKKNPKTGKRALTEFGAMAQARGHVDRFVELTGTPSPNGIRDLGGQIYMLDGGRRLGANKTAFEQRWFDADYMGYKLEPKPHAHKEIMGLVKDIMIGMRAEDYIELPPFVPNIIKVDLPDKAMREYKRFERTLVSDAYDVEAVSRGVLTNKLLQFANGSMYQETEFDEATGKKVRPPAVPIHDAKLEPLDRIIEEAAGESVLVAYSFRFDLERIRKAFPSAVVFDEEPNFIKLWNAKKIGIGLAHPASVGHGLNMQFGGHICVWYGLTWSLELYQQFNRRLARPGQPHPLVTGHHILARGTMDEVAYATMNSKGATQDAVNDAVRIRLIA